VVVVVTSLGPIEGSERDRHLAFLGIPFAAPPLASLRFRAPEPHAPWSPTLETKTFRAAAPQGFEFAPGVKIDGPQSEDCLYLNVFTPAADSRKRPVMFWVHGGAFTVGTAGVELYDGGALASRGDVVVVTANYRVGALGFGVLPESTGWGARANLGLLDLVAALRWVRDNIASFGGDPENVTLFGESAGGTCVSLLTVMDEASGLFRRAIVQSGTGPVRLARLDRAAETGGRLLYELGLTAAQSERLQSISLPELMRAQAVVEADAATWPHFYPVLDGLTFKEHPRDSLAAGKAKHIPLLIGTNRDEWNLFAAPEVAAWGRPLAKADAVDSLASKLPRAARERALGMLEVYRASRAARGLPQDARALLRALEGDLRFRIPSLRWAEAHVASGGSTFMYLFTYGSPGLRGALGACHALEIAFVFGTLTAPNQERFAGKGPEVQALSRRMMDAWLAFARTGEPADSPWGAWPRYELERRATMRIDLQSELVTAPFDEERLAWDGVI
jgi:para-nitrobenzyl esterase